MLNNVGLKFFTAALLAALLTVNRANAEFALNFQPNPSVVSSIANQDCNGGGGGMMGGMMGMVGPGCGNGYFLQQIVNDNGAQYYHVIVGDPAQDNFALEFYMRTSGCCWFGGGMGGGMGGGGDAPYSSSYGDVNDPLFNAWQPLSNNPAAGNASGNPNRVYMRQINNDPTISQEFIKNTEANKPHIIQTVTSGTAMTSTFDLDMSNGGYGAYNNPAGFSNRTTVTGVDDFDATASSTATLTAGRFRYTPGNSFSGSFGNYNYESGGIDTYGIDWLSYCEAAQNPDHQCIFSSGGGMMGGMGGMGM